MNELAINYFDIFPYYIEFISLVCCDMF